MFHPLGLKMVEVCSNRQPDMNNVSNELVLSESFVSSQGVCEEMYLAKSLK